MRQTYSVTVGGEERLRFRADLVEASAPIRIVGANGTSRPTPFQTANARHQECEAAELLNRWCRSEGGECWEEDEDYEIDVVDEE